MTAPEIPASVPREEVLAFCRHLGFDPNLLVSLEFGVYGVYVTLFFTDDEGHKVSDGNDAAKHRIFVPITEGQAS